MRNGPNLPPRSIALSERLRIVEGRLFVLQWRTNILCKLIAIDKSVNYNSQRIHEWYPSKRHNEFGHGTSTLFERLKHSTLNLCSWDLPGSDSRWSASFVQCKPLCPGRYFFPLVDPCRAMKARIILSRCKRDINVLGQINQLGIVQRDTIHRWSTCTWASLRYYLTKGQL